MSTRLSSTFFFFDLQISRFAYLVAFFLVVEWRRARGFVVVGDVICFAVFDVSVVFDDIVVYISFSFSRCSFIAMLFLTL